MKIGIVSNLYPPDARGGAELVAQRIADALYERGHNVFVLTTQKFDGIHTLFPRISERTLAAVYRFFPLNVYSMQNDHFVPFPIRAIWHVLDLYNPLSRRAIRHLIKAEEPDLIISHNLKGIGVSIAKEIQKQGVPHIHTLHDVQLSVPSGLLIAGCENSFLNRSFLRRWYEKAVRKNIGTPDIVISPSKFLADFYKERNIFTDTRNEVLPNPLPPVSTNPRGERLPRRTQFLFVGQLEKHKGVLELFDALDQMGDDVELHIAGEGALTEYVCERAKLDRRIRYHGFVSLKHLINLLQTSDAAVIPSICYENSPTVIYESLLAGVPVIASRIGGIPELVKEDETGILITPGDIKELISAMKEIHNNRDAWWDRSAQIQTHAQQYSITNYVDKLEALIKDI
jgi:glycosyltransferase involved in cell wall biosynthesis